MRRREARAARGFTLIELLVVLMILGLVVGLASAIVRPDDRAVLHLEAGRLQQLLDLAAGVARLTGKPIAWTADAAGYRFSRESEGSGWTEVLDDDLLRARSLPQGVTITDFRIENMRPQGAMRLEFAPEGISAAFSIRLALGAERIAVEGSPIGELRVAEVQGAVSGAAPH
jgi:general secretion pathway protein H